MHAQEPDAATRELIQKLLNRIDGLEKRVAELEVNEQPALRRRWKPCTRSTTFIDLLRKVGSSRNRVPATLFHPRALHSRKLMIRRTSASQPSHNSRNKVK